MSRYIDVDALLEIVDHYILHDEDARKHHSALFIEGMKDGYYRIKSKVLNMPTADVVKVKHGEWIVLYDEDSPQDGIWKCSMCDYIRFVDDITPTSYCPNCGADMRGE